MLKMFSIRLFMFISCLVSVLVLARPAREDQCQDINCECLKDERGLEYHCPEASWHRKIIIEKLDIERTVWRCLHVDDTDKYIPNTKLYARELTIIDCPLTRKVALNTDFDHIEELTIVDSLMTSGFVEILTNCSENKIKKLTLRSVKFEENVDFDHFMANKLERLELRDVDFKIGKKLFEEEITLKDLDLRWNHINNVEGKIFDNLFFLKTLDLAKNNLVSMNSDVFEGLFQLVRLYLEENNIQFFGKGIFRDLKRLVSLDLSKNKICFLHKDILKPLESLREINLSHNDGLELDDYVFSNLPELREIEIAYLNMKQIPENIFRGSINITRINMESNSISHIPSFLFDGLSHLTNLNMKNNDIKTLDNSIFHSLISLATLDLSWNKMERLTSELLRPLLDLHYIDVSYNRIHYIGDRCFWNKTNLRHIYFSNNNYKYSVESKYIPGKTPFDECTHLLTLDLGFNIIEDIPWYPLNKGKYLETLILKGNKIKYLDVSLIWKIAYKGLHLNLEDNEISKVIFNSTALPQEAEDPFNEEASYVYLANNPLHCDFEACAFIKFIENVMGRSADWGILFVFGHLTCASPKNVEGVEVSRMCDFGPDCC